MSDLSTGIYRAQGPQQGGEPQRAYKGRKGTNAFAELAEGDEVEVAETYRRQNGATWGRISSINGEASEGFVALMSKNGAMKMDRVEDARDRENASDDEHEGAGDAPEEEPAGEIGDVLEQLKDAAELQDEVAPKAQEEEAERKAEREEAARREREEAERKLKEDADRRMKEEAAEKAREQAERKMRDEAEAEKAREEAERKVRKEAEVEAARFLAEQKALKEVEAAKLAEEIARADAEKRAHEEQKLRLQQAEESKRAMVGSLKIPTPRDQERDPPLFRGNSGLPAESPAESPRYADDTGQGPGGRHTLAFLAFSGVLAGLLMPFDVFGRGHRAKQALALGAVCAVASTRDDVLGHVLRSAGRSGAERSHHGHAKVRSASLRAKVRVSHASARAQSRVQSRVEKLDLPRLLRDEVLFPLGEAVFAFRAATSLSKLGITSEFVK